MRAPEGAINDVDPFRGLGDMNPADVKLRVPYVVVPPQAAPSQVVNSTKARFLHPVQQPPNPGGGGGGG